MNETLIILAVAARVITVIDGDTIRVEAEVWPNHRVMTSVRIDDVDTPELRGKCAHEKQIARDAKEFVQGRVGDNVFLVNVRNGKFAGRVVADVLLSDGTLLSKLIIENGHGRVYTGGKRGGWCENVP